MANFTSAELDRACREVGFFGHGVDPKLIERVELVSRDFFNRPIEEKMEVHIGDTGAVRQSAAAK